MMTSIDIKDYSESQVLRVDADKQTIAKVLAFIAQLNQEQQIKT